MRMKSPVRGIVVFPIAIFVKGPSLHRRIGTVIRQGENYGVPRATVGAVDIGIAVTAIAGIGELAQALVAHRKIG